MSSLCNALLDRSLDENRGPYGGDYSTDSSHRMRTNSVATGESDRSRGSNGSHGTDLTKTTATTATTVHSSSCCCICNSGLCAESSDDDNYHDRVNDSYTIGGPDCIDGRQQQTEHATGGVLQPQLQQADPLIECVGCGIMVHASCYDAPEGRVCLPALTTAIKSPWSCNRCTFVPKNTATLDCLVQRRGHEESLQDQRQSATLLQYSGGRCIACPRLGGALKVYPRCQCENPLGNDSSGSRGTAIDQRNKCNGSLESKVGAVKFIHAICLQLLFFDRSDKGSVKDPLNGQENQLSTFYCYSRRPLVLHQACYMCYDEEDDDDDNNNESVEKVDYDDDRSKPRARSVYGKTAKCLETDCHLFMHASCAGKSDQLVVSVVAADPRGDDSNETNGWQTSAGSDNLRLPVASTFASTSKVSKVKGIKIFSVYCWSHIGAERRRRRLSSQPRPLPRPLPKQSLADPINCSLMATVNDQLNTLEPATTATTPVLPTAAGEAIEASTGRELLATPPAPAEPSDGHEDVVERNDFGENRGGNETEETGKNKTEAGSLPVNHKTADQPRRWSTLSTKLFHEYLSKRLPASPVSQVITIRSTVVKREAIVFQANVKHDDGRGEKEIVIDKKKEKKDRDIGHYDDDNDDGNCRRLGKEIREAAVPARGSIKRKAGLSPSQSSSQSSSLSLTTSSNKRAKLSLKQKNNNNNANVSTNEITANRLRQATALVNNDGKRFRVPKSFTVTSAAATDNIEEVKKTKCVVKPKTCRRSKKADSSQEKHGFKVTPNLRRPVPHTSDSVLASYLAPVTAGYAVTDKSETNLRPEPDRGSFTTPSRMDTDSSDSMSLQHLASEACKLSTEPSVGVLPAESAQTSTSEDSSSADPVVLDAEEPELELQMLQYIAKCQQQITALDAELQSSRAETRLWKSRFVTSEKAKFDLWTVMKTETANLRKSHEAHMDPLLTVVNKWTPVPDGCVSQCVSVTADVQEHGDESPTSAAGSVVQQSSSPPLPVQSEEPKGPNSQALPSQLPMDTTAENVVTEIEMTPDSESINTALTLPEKGTEPNKQTTSAASSAVNRKESDKPGVTATLIIPQPVASVPSARLSGEFVMERGLEPGALGNCQTLAQLAPPDANTTALLNDDGAQCFAVAAKAAVPSLETSASTPGSPPPPMLTQQSPVHDGPHAYDSDSVRTETPPVLSKELPTGNRRAPRCSKSVTDVADDFMVASFNKNSNENVSQPKVRVKGFKLRKGLKPNMGCGRSPTFFSMSDFVTDSEPELETSSDNEEQHLRPAVIKRADSSGIDSGTDSDTDSDHERYLPLDEHRETEDEHYKSSFATAYEKQSENTEEWLPDRSIANRRGRGRGRGRRGRGRSVGRRGECGQERSTVSQQQQQQNSDDSDDRDAVVTGYKYPQRRRGRGRGRGKGRGRGRGRGRKCAVGSTESETNCPVDQSEAQMMTEGVNCTSPTTPPTTIQSLTTSQPSEKLQLVLVPPRALTSLSQQPTEVNIPQRVGANKRKDYTPVRRRDVGNMSPVKVAYDCFDDPSCKSPRKWLPLVIDPVSTEEFATEPAKCVNFASIMSAITGTKASHGLVSVQQPKSTAALGPSTAESPKNLYHGRRRRRRRRQQQQQQQQQQPIGPVLSFGPMNQDTSNCASGSRDRERFCDASKVRNGSGSEPINSVPNPRRKLLLSAADTVTADAIASIRTSCLRCGCKFKGTYSHFQHICNGKMSKSNSKTVAGDSAHRQPQIMVTGHCTRGAVKHALRSQCPSDNDFEIPNLKQAEDANKYNNRVNFKRKRKKRKEMVVEVMMLPAKASDDDDDDNTTTIKKPKLNQSEENRLFLQNLYKQHIAKLSCQKEAISREQAEPHGVNDSGVGTTVLKADDATHNRNTCTTSVYITTASSTRNNNCWQNHLKVAETKRLCLGGDAATKSKDSSNLSSAASRAEPRGTAEVVVVVVGTPGIEPSAESVSAIPLVPTPPLPSPAIQPPVSKLEIEQAGPNQAARTMIICKHVGCGKCFYFNRQMLNHLIKCHTQTML